MHWFPSCVLLWSVFTISNLWCKQYNLNDVDALIDLYYKLEEERLQKIIPKPGPDLTKDVITGALTDDVVPRDRTLEKAIQDMSLQQRLFEFIADNLSFFDRSEVDQKELLKLLASNARYNEHVSKCVSEIKTPQCNDKYLYRTQDGTCNNLKNPLWGCTQNCGLRLLPAHYEGSSKFRKSVTGEDLPEPRQLTLSLNPDIEKLDESSHFFTFFGQAVAHDISLSPSQTVDGTLDCCETPEISECIPIILPSTDRFNKNLNVTCQNFIRVGPCRTCSIGKRAQVNQVSSALDASFVYGSTEGINRKLRAFDGTGGLKSRNMEAGELLPNNEDFNALFCPKYMSSRCFFSGDGRVNQSALLMMMHIVFHRYHNYIVKTLKRLNPYWEDEQLYHEGRKILIGIYQNIVYTEYLPVLFKFDWNIFTNFDLWVGANNSTYDDTVKIGTLAEFGGGSFRLHSMVDNYVFVDGMRKERFRDMHVNADIIYEGYMDKFLMGTCKTPSQMFDRFMTKDMTENTNKEPRSVFGTDLQAMDIQRGRDLGFPPYTEFVKFCTEGSITINSFEDLVKYNFSTLEDVKLLQQHYKSVEDLDLMLGMQFDPHNRVLHCINAHQFRILKSGDRFFFTNGNLPSSFKLDQIQELLRTSFASVLCSVTNISKIQKKVFLLPSEENPIVSCSEIPKVNLQFWKENK